MSSLGSAQWFRGLLPGTDRESSRATAWPPKMEPAEAEAAKSAEAMLRSFILLCLVWYAYRWMCNLDKSGVLVYVYVGSLFGARIPQFPSHELSDRPGD
jgi:hypothetical protein